MVGAINIERKMNNYENMTLTKAEMNIKTEIEIVKEAIEAVKELIVSKEAKWQIAGAIEPIALRILSWAIYHEDVFDLSYDNTIGFLNYTFFTEQGIIDSEKVAKEINEKLVHDENLHFDIRYKLACTYCFNQKTISDLWKEVLEKEFFYNNKNPDKIEQPELVKFWSYLVTGDIDKLKGGQSVGQYRFEAAIKDGSEVAVKHYWPKLEPSERSNIVDFAMQVLEHKLESEYDHRGRIPLDIVNNIHSYDSEWFPVEYYNDILFFLLSQMKEMQKIEFFKRDNSGSIVLDCFLEWPYQHYFIEVANLMWGVLPVDNYARLLSGITDRFTNKGSYNYFTEKLRNDYDYCKLFKEFWSQSSDKYKRYILGDEQEHETLKDLILKLFEINNFTSSIDEKNVELIKLILKYATPKEKESIISFDEWNTLCSKLIMVEKWELLEEVIEKCISEEQIDQFKKEFYLDWEAFSYLVRQDKLSLEDEIEKWSARSKEETKMYKRERFFSPCAKGICFDFIVEDKLEFADKFVRWNLSSEEEIKEFKINFVSEFGNDICKTLIAERKMEDIYDEQGLTIGRTLNFKRGKWEQVEMFLTWAFSSEEEIREFKVCVLQRSVITIHYDLIYANRWEEAETFFAWLDLSKDAIKNLKKETIIKKRIINRYLYRDSDGNFADYAGGEREKIKLLLRWCLADKKAVLEFKDEFDEAYGYEYKGGERKKRKIILNKFNGLFKELLDDLAEDEGIKRKTLNEISELPNKSTT